MYLVIENEGEIPIDALTIIGASDKEHRDSIGQFGSGIKYAIAAAMRNNIGLRITVGNKKVCFGTVLTELGRATVNRITIRVGWAGRWQPRDWTTDMGRHDWRDKEDQDTTVEYMIVREFVTNAMDEIKGCHIYPSNKITAVKGLTRVYIDCTPKVQAIEDNPGLYFLRYSSRKPTFTSSKGTVYPATGNGRIYTKGIFVRTPPQPTVFDYDFPDLSITESRTVDPYVLQSRIGTLWAALPAEQLAEAFAKLEDDSVSWFESGISSWQFGSFDQETAAKAVQSLRGDKVVIVHKNAIPDNSVQPMVAMPDGLYCSLANTLECHPKASRQITCPTCNGLGTIEANDTDCPF